MTTQQPVTAEELADVFDEIQCVEEFDALLQYLAERGFIQT